MSPRFFYIFVAFVVLISIAESRLVKHHNSGNKLNSKLIRQTKDHNNYQIHPNRATDSSPSPVSEPAVGKSRRTAHHSNYRIPHNKFKYENSMDEQYSQYPNRENGEKNFMRDEESVQEFRNEHNNNMIASGKREVLNDAFETADDANEIAPKDAADLKFLDTGISDDSDSIYNLKTISQVKEYNANGKVAQNGEKRVYRNAQSSGKRFERVADLNLGDSVSEDGSEYAELNLPYGRGYIGSNSATEKDFEGSDAYGRLRRDRRKARAK